MQRYNCLQQCEPQAALDDDYDSEEIKAYGQVLGTSTATTECVQVTCKAYNSFMQHKLCLERLMKREEEDELHKLFRTEFYENGLDL